MRHCTQGLPYTVRRTADAVFATLQTKDCHSKGGGNIAPMEQTEPQCALHSMHASIASLSLMHQSFSSHNKGKLTLQYMPRLCDLCQDSATYAKTETTAQRTLTNLGS